MIYRLIIFILFVLTESIAGYADEDRYTIIQSLLNQYQRPFTTIDICADQGYYSLRIAHDYNSVNVMIEGNNQLLEICKAHTELSNIILLNFFIAPNILQHLSECEHFDVVLALNALRKFGADWMQAAEAILNMGDHIFIEIWAEDKEIEGYIVAKGGQLLATLPADQDTALYMIKSSNHFLRRKTWLRGFNRLGTYRIVSSFTEKMIVKPKERVRANWIPGINLCTFKMCYGVYPTIQQLKDSLQALKNVRHNDWMINNMIVQGKALAFIDFNGKYRKRFFSEAALARHMEILEINDPEQVRQYFWNRLLPRSRK